MGEPDYGEKENKDDEKNTIKKLTEMVRKRVEDREKRIRRLVLKTRIQGNTERTKVKGRSMKLRRYIETRTHTVKLINLSARRVHVLRTWQRKHGTQFLTRSVTAC